MICIVKLKLTFGELFVGSCASESDLLAFDHTRVTFEKSGFFERGTCCREHLDDSSGNAETDSSGLASKPAAVRIDEYVQLAFNFCDFEGFSCLSCPENARKIIFYFAIVDEEFAVAVTDADACDGILSSACAPDKGRG